MTVRILTVVTLASALMLSLGVSPAGAGAAGRAATWTDCDSLGTQFSSYGRLLESARAAGKFKREPDLGKATEIGPQRGRGDGFSETVPTWFHVVHHANGSGNVSNKAVWQQLYVLNGTFGGFEGGTAGGFNFTMAGITRTANTTWYNAGPESPAEHAMKIALHAGGDNTLNVYLTSGGGYLGWAYFPDITNTPQAYLDGVVVDWRSMLETSTAYAGQYDLGKTLPHEAGHWLNLYHTFEGCSSPGDYVADTPPQALATTGCPIGQDSCPSSPGLDPIHNYMDYSYDSCYYEFTPGQVVRMHDAWIEWREN